MHRNMLDVTLATAQSLGGPSAWKFALWVWSALNMVKRGQGTLSRSKRSVMVTVAGRRATRVVRFSVNLLESVPAVEELSAKLNAVITARREEEARRRFAIKTGGTAPIGVVTPAQLIEEGITAPSELELAAEGRYVDERVTTEDAIAASHNAPVIYA
jgi:hypothetical protein